MRIRPFLLVPVVVVVFVAGCAQAEASHVEYGPAVTAEPSPARTVSTSGGEGLTCVDDLLVEYAEPGFDIDQVGIAVDAQALTATYTVGRLAYEQTANTRFNLLLKPSDGGAWLQLEGWLPWSGSPTVSQWTTNGGDREIAGGSIVRTGSQYTVTWPREDLIGDIPADFSWSASVLYNQNKRDFCPGGRDERDETMHGSWTVPPAG